MIIEMNSLSPTEAYRLMTQSIMPRPIAWVLTRNVGVDSLNVAPFSYFAPVSSQPPLLMFSVAPKDSSGALKDSVINIVEHREFVVHIASSAQMENVQASAQPLPYGETELTLIDSQCTDFAGASLPRLAACPIAFACTLYEKTTIGDVPQTLIFGEITHTFVSDEHIEGEAYRSIIDAHTVNPLSRLGLNQYADIDNIRRPKA